MKYQALKYARETGHFATTCGIYAAWYYEQFLDKATADVFGGFPTTPDEEGYITFRAPLWGDDEHPSFVSITHDFGDMVHGILLEPEQWDGKSVPAASDVMTFEQLAQTLQNGIYAYSHLVRVLMRESQLRVESRGIFHFPPGKTLVEASLNWMIISSCLPLRKQLGDAILAMCPQRPRQP